jgi:BirA family biotin operon repressor/biotin-[acetyl-CoA-carboxylase] ligase
MTLARERALAGAPAGSVVVADYQSEGRGTHGRTWLAAPGTCLMFTILLRPAVDASALEPLPRLVSASVCATVNAAFHVGAVVKEPNDILVNGRKLCGVLCTSHVRGSAVDWVLCGIGLNTTMRLDQLPLDSATSLLTEGVEPPPHSAILNLLLDDLCWLLEPRFGDE